MGRFTSKTVLVTGADGGIGVATAKRFGSEGARVVCASRDHVRTVDAAEQAKIAGSPEAWGVACDVSDGNAVTALVDRTLEKFGSLHVVVNNAGLMSTQPLVELDGDAWRRILDVDLIGAFHLSRQALLRMPHGGSVVNVSSIHAIATAVGIGPYAAAKAALVSLTRTTALEGTPRGIRANVVLPGAIDTPLLWQNPNVKSGAENIDASQLGKPEDVAAAICFLASDDARFIQGTSLVVDGGRLSKL